MGVIGLSPPARNITRPVLVETSRGRLSIVLQNYHTGMISANNYCVICTLRVRVWQIVPNPSGKDVWQLAFSQSFHGESREDARKREITYRQNNEFYREVVERGRYRNIRYRIHAMWVC